MHATGKYSQGLMVPAISEGSFKSTKTIYHITSLAMESSEMLVLLLQPKRYVSCVFVYNVVDVNKKSFLFSKTASINQRNMIHFQIAYRVRVIIYHCGLPYLMKFIGSFRVCCPLNRSGVLNLPLLQLIITVQHMHTIL